MSFQVAKEVLSQADKDRLVCAVLHSKNFQTDWEAAAADYGSASTSSFKVMHGNAMRKVEKIMGSKRSQVEGEEEIAPTSPKEAKVTKPRKKKEQTEAGKDKDIEGEGREEEQVKIKAEPEA